MIFVLVLVLILILIVLILIILILVVLILVVLILVVLILIVLILIVLHFGNLLAMRIYHLGMTVSVFPFKTLLYRIPMLAVVSNLFQNIF